MNKDCICRIRKVYRAIASFESELQKKLGLNINETVLLCLVSDKENISCGEISETMELSNSNASKVVASLEKNGYIRRKLCKDDKRCMRFKITKKGEELLEKMSCEKLQLPDNLTKLSKEV